MRPSVICHGPMCHSVFLHLLLTEEAIPLSNSTASSSFSHLLQKMRQRFLNFLSLLSILLLFFYLYSTSYDNNDPLENTPTIPGERQLQINIKL